MIDIYSIVFSKTHESNLNEFIKNFIHVIWSYLHTLKLLLDSIYILYSHSSVHLTSLAHHIQFVLSTCLQLVSIHWSMVDFSVMPIFTGNWLFFTQHLSINKVPQSNSFLHVGVFFFFPGLVCSGLVHAAMLTPSSYVQKFCSVEKILFPYSHPLPLTIAIITIPSSTMLCEPWVEGLWYRYRFRGKHSTVS